MTQPRIIRLIQNCAAASFLDPVFDEAEMQLLHNRRRRNLHMGLEGRLNLIIPTAATLLTI
jgi:hypothetical protein